MNAAKAYLRLASAYCEYLGGVRWSGREDALEYPDGTTFAFNEEVALFLEGFAGGGRLIPFAYVLHLLDMLRNTHRVFAPGTLRLSYAFADAGRPLRNAGAFCAALCRGLPEAAGPVPAHEVLARLRNQAMPIRWYIVSFHDTFFPAEVPPLEPAAFEDHVVRRLAAYTNEDLRQWLRTGRGPVRQAAEDLTRELPLPRTLSGALAALLERPRLAGARPFVARLVSALTLPLRRLAPPELPVGGYTDVTTHGRPDQILPGQLALDEWDFLRRYADRELLYFRREEPHARTDHELVVLLDQGVRTWGDVRLVLSAAVLALGRQAERKRLPFRVAATSGGGQLLDPVEADDAALGALVEASDLTASPGLALEQVLERPAEAPRDVVLLTHPRALREEDVRAAARRAGPETRLFALALDGEGRAELSELRHGAPVPVRQFRVDLSADVPEVLPEPQRVRASGTWRGDVEPIGFPFRFGLGDPVAPNLMDFDQAGEWLLTASAAGMLHAWRTDGGGMEVLPRPMLGGALLAQPQAVVGVAGGFVVGGQVGDRPAAFHYDFASRACTGRFLAGGQAPGRWHWDYSAAHHSLLVHTGGTGWALDLGTGWLWTTGEDGPELRARQAWRAWAAHRVPRRRLHVPGTSPAPTREPTGPWCFLDLDTGEVRLGGVSPPWERFTPVGDGRPRLKLSYALEARYSGTTLGLKTATLGSKAGCGLHLFRGPQGIPAGEYAVASADFGFVLSADGELLARQVTQWLVEVRWVDGGRPVTLTRAGGFSAAVELELGEDWLLIHSNHQSHLLRWREGPLAIRHLQGAERQSFLASFPAGPLSHGVRASPGDVPLALHYDSRRFVAAAWGKLLAVADRFGQVTLLDDNLEVVCMLFVVRGGLAGWLPDGTCFGPAAVTGRPAAPDALQKIGAALRQATARGRRRP
jgi:hypothetical protein